MIITANTVVPPLLSLLRAKGAELIQFMLMCEFEAEHHSRKDHAAC